jgi:hypothetical protein
MQFFVNDELIKELTPTQLKVIAHDLLNVDEEMRRRVHDILMAAYERSFANIKHQWEIKLAERGEEFIPTNKDAFAELVFKQPDYKNRAQREEEAINAANAANQANANNR